METTRKYPRTLAEAFGPHTSEKIEEPAEGHDVPRALLMWAAFIAALVLVVVLVNPQGVVR
jgi:hypothetical protein